MVITVLAVGMMKMSVAEEVDMVAVRYRLVATALAVDMGGIVAPALVTVRAAVRMLLIDLQRVLVYVVAVG